VKILYWASTADGNAARSKGEVQRTNLRAMKTEEQSHPHLNPKP
jgi:hypothetical protein